MEANLVLASQSEVQIPGGFAKPARTLKNQYFFSFVARNCRQSTYKTGKLTEVCQNGVWKLVLVGVLACAVSIK
jgi:hypothetical protein